jgi:hypothetical protein
MITDIFAKRYADDLEFDLAWADKIIGPTLVQANHIFLDDVQKQFRFKEDFFRVINQRLARELGLLTLKKQQFSIMNEQEVCTSYLTSPWQDSNSWYGDPDHYCKTRMSLLELLFRETEERARRFGFANKAAAGFLNTVSNAIQELNVRLRTNGTGLIYNNGFLHLADDQITAERIAKPFWDIVADPKLAVVDQEMKEAIDRLDHGQQDAATYATKALESTIKIISDGKGWTTGNEKSAPNYIDNLVSARNGRFIEVWEADALKHIFSKVRNPHSHGGGSNPPPALSDAQQTWAIETCMSWIKSLVRRP